MANRLSENKRWNVLLLEAGRQETFVTDVPLTASANSATSYNWGYRTDPNSQNACLGLEYVSCSFIFIRSHHWLAGDDECSEQQRRQIKSGSKAEFSNQMSKRAAEGV